jgi:hypothetical protein
MADPCVRVRRAYQAGMGLARQVEVIAVASLADEQPSVLAPENRSSEALVCGSGA